MAAEGIAVRKGGLALPERLGDPVAHNARGDGGISARHALGAGDHVGHVAELGARKHAAEAAERADHLVRDEEHVVPIADLADPLEVTGRRREAAA
jgi:hypothetical protein